MYEIDISTLDGFIATVWQLLSGILRLDPDAFRAVVASSADGQLALVILFISGLSITLGQSVVLFANRISRTRFVFSLIMSTAWLVLGVVFWAVTIWLVAATLFDTQRPLPAVLAVVAISHAPYLFGLLVLLPYLGNIIYQILRIWTLLALTVGVMVLFEFSLATAVLCGFLGWLILELIARLRLISAIDNWFWRFATGTPRQMSTQDMVDQYVETADQYVQSAGDQTAPDSTQTDKEEQP